MHVLHEVLVHCMFHRGALHAQSGTWQLADEHRQDTAVVCSKWVLNILRVLSILAGSLPAGVLSCAAQRLLPTLCMTLPGIHGQGDVCAAIVQRMNLLVRQAYELGACSSCLACLALVYPGGQPHGMHAPSMQVWMAMLCGSSDALAVFYSDFGLRLVQEAAQVVGIYSAGDAQHALPAMHDIPVTSPCLLRQGLCTGAERWMDLGRQLTGEEYHQSAARTLLAACDLAVVLPLFRKLEARRMWLLYQVCRGSCPSSQLLAWVQFAYARVLAILYKVRTQVPPAS